MVAKELSIGERRLGEYPRREAGQANGRGHGTLIVIACGLHGNEPAGVLAARRVFAELERTTPLMHGRVLALAGNIGALERGQRYVEHDLNRLWTEEEIARVRTLPDGDGDAETREQVEMLRDIEEAIDAGWERVVLLDLHSTSADGSPFIIMADTLRNRDIAFALHIPIMLGLEEGLPGTLSSYFSERGHTAICVEGGQNDLTSTVDHHEAAIWLTLVAAGLLAREDVVNYDEHAEGLRNVTFGLPQVFEIRHREPIPPGTFFSMNPGFANFHRVKQGEPLAVLGEGDALKTLVTPLDGWLFMPRYQGLGDDAFFVGDEVGPSRLRLGAWLRRMRLEWVLGLLPGIERHATQVRAFCADVERLGRNSLEMLHLFGYRKVTRDGSRAVFIRRP